MKKIIDIPSRDVWESIKEHAGKMSVSSYLIGLHFASLEYQDSVKSAQPAEEKIYLAWRDGIEPDPKGKK